MNVKQLKTFLANYDLRDDMLVVVSNAKNEHSVIAHGVVEQISSDYESGEVSELETQDVLELFYYE